MGQPVRRRHDRADRLFAPAITPWRLRRAADAGHRLSLPAILSARRRAHRAGGHPRRERSAGARRSSSAWSATSRATLAALLPQLTEQDRSRLLDAAVKHYRNRARVSMTWPPASPAAADPSAAYRPGDERPRRRRCGLHLRCRPADGLGGALSGDERQAPADRLVLARLDGQRDGAGDRRAGRVSRPAGDLALGRRRLHHADGRSAEPDAARAAGEGRRVQQRRARVRRAGTEIHRLHEPGTELQNPNFAALAEAVGIKGVRIDDPAEVEAKLARRWRIRDRC